jgi:hypothetical protein
MADNSYKTKLNEERARFKSIYRYIVEQEDNVVPPAEGETLPPPPGDELPPVPGGELPPPPGDELPPVPGGELPPPPTGDAPDEGNNTEEIDVTELVNIAKSLKKDMEEKKGNENGVTGKMEDIFTKLTDLENKLGEMGNIIQKIDQLGQKVDNMKPQTPVEKLEMRSLDSYPFNQKPTEFFSQKQDEMRRSGKNEYILTKDDVQNYGKDQIRKSFLPIDDEDDNLKYYDTR